MAITILNLTLATIVLIIGVLVYFRNKSNAALSIGIAFGLFAVSHFLTLLGFATALNTPLIVIRTIGYLAAILAVIILGKTCTK